jgi:3',5'-cyclic AMP phosphodiesterase CpdA
MSKAQVQPLQLPPGCGHPSRRMFAMRTIVHLSDLHFGRLDRQVVDPLLRAIDQAEPDVVAISGDLTQRARHRQFAEARTFLQAVGAPLVVVPGNHDVPLYDVGRRFLSPLGRYRRFISRDLEPVFADDEMMIIGLNSARSLTFGRGRLNEAQVRRAADHLRGAAPSLLKIVVTHHPFDLPDDYDSKHLVGRARMAMTVLAAVNADLFLAGHLHVSHIGATAERYRIAGHSALVVQAGTMSMRQRGEVNSFNVLRLHRPHISVERRMWDEDGRIFAEAPPRMFRHTDRGWQEEQSC